MTLPSLSAISLLFSALLRLLAAVVSEQFPTSDKFLENCEDVILHKLFSLVCTTEHVNSDQSGTDEEEEAIVKDLHTLPHWQSWDYCRVLETPFIKGYFLSVWRKDLDQGTAIQSFCLYLISNFQ